MGRDGTISYRMHTGRERGKMARPGRIVGRDGYEGQMGKIGEDSSDGQREVLSREKHDLRQESLRGGDNS